MPERIELGLNAEELHRELDGLDEHLRRTEEEAERVISFVDRESVQAMQKVMAASQLSINAVETVVRAAGGSWSRM
jgi:hypothetical protein